MVSEFKSESDLELTSPDVPQPGHNSWVTAGTYKPFTRNKPTVHVEDSFDHDD